MMKKIIALALALSMALSMVAFAGYTDAAEIDADLTADVELVKALGLMTGNPDGSFNPKGTLTRAEAAVIIYRLHSGKSTIDASWGDKTLNSFTDMDHWSVAYVNYCSALGLVTGYPDNTFRPENPVTAAEMAKMLLNVAGYDTEKQGYGANWPGAVLADASNAGLFEKYDAAFTGAATREWVAKMVSNMLKVKVVVYAYGSYLQPTENTFGEKYGVQIADVAVAKANDTDAIGGNDKAAKDTSVVGTATIKYDIPTELLGHDVTVYYQGKALNTEAKIYAVMDASKKVLNTTMDQVKYKKNSTTNKMELIVDGVVVDDDVKTAPAAFESLEYKNTTTFGSSALKDNRAVELVYNKSIEQWYAKYNKVEYAKVTDIKASEYKFKAGALQLAGTTTDNKEAKEDYAAINFVDTVAKNDYVAIETVGQHTKTYNVSKLTALRTKISSNLNGTKFTVGENTYEANAVYMSSTGITTGYADFATFMTGLTGGKDGGLTKTYDIYTNGKYVVYAEQYDNTPATIAGLKEVAYLIAHADATEGDVFTGDTLGKVQVMFADGTIAIYEYSAPTADDAIKVDLTTVNNDTIYEYILNEDGTIYFKQLATDFVDAASTKAAWVKDTAISNLSVNKDVAKTNMKIGDTTVYANENSFLFVKLTKNDKTKYSVVKVSELGAGSDWTGYTFGATSAYTYDKTTGLNYLAYGVVSHADADKLPAAADGATGSDWFLVLETATAVTTEAGTTYSVKGINAKGEYTTLVLTSKELGTAEATKAADKDNTNDVAKNTLYTVKSNSKSTWLTTASNWKEAAITASTGSAVVIDGAMTDVAADAVIVYLKETSTNDKYEQVSGPATIPFGAEAVYYTLKNDKVNQLIIVVDKDNKIVSNNEINVPVA